MLLVNFQPAAYIGSRKINHLANSASNWFRSIISYFGENFWEGL